MDPMDREIISTLSRYIRIDTSNPPGDCSAAVKFLVDCLGSRGYVPLTAGKVKEKESIYCNLGGDSMPGIVFLHHMDVVPAVEEEWSFHPFCGEVRDGYVLGRGTLDTKGLGVAQIFGVLKAARERGTLKKKVFIVANPDEEIGGGEGAGYFVKDHGKMLKGCYGLNEGGIGVRDLFGPGDFFLVNMWEKGPLWLKLTARGRAGHGSRPTGMDSTFRLVKGLGRLLEWEEGLEVTEPVKAMLNELARRGVVSMDKLEKLEEIASTAPEMEAVMKDTVAVTMLEGGFKPNVIPAVAEAAVDMRILPGRDPEAVVEKVKGILDGLDIEVEVLFASKPSGSEGTPFFDLIGGAVEKVYPGAIPLPYLSTGFTDSRFYRESGVTTYGLLPCVIPKEELGRIHGVDERISVDAVVKASEVIKHLVLMMEDL